MKNSAVEQLKRRLKFEMLLSEISAGFINLPAGQIDEIILNSQRRVCELLGLDFSALWQFCLSKIPITFIKPTFTGLWEGSPFRRKWRPNRTIHGF